MSEEPTDKQKEAVARLDDRAANKQLKNTFTEKDWPIYCACLEATGQYIVAADALGVSYRKTYIARSEFPELQQMCDEALERYRSKFIAEAQRRAVEGYTVPIIGGQYRDEIVAEERRYSDRLLELFLKRAPDGSFVERRAVTVDGSMQLRQQFDLSKLSKKARRFLRNLLEQLKVDENKHSLGLPIDDDGSNEPG